MSTELKPCSHCGGKEIRFDRHVDGRSPTGEVWSMCCYTCGATFPNRYKKELLTAAWNRRAPDPALTTEREQSRRMREALEQARTLLNSDYVFRAEAVLDAALATLESEPEPSLSQKATDLFRQSLTLMKEVKAQCSESEPERGERKVELPPATDRGLAGQILDAAWPAFGGNHQSAEFWSAFADAVEFTLRIRSPLSRRDVLEEAARSWRCFHCDEEFTDIECAREHFGSFEDCLPACKIGVEQYRKLEAELQSWRSESDHGTREFYALGADHERKMRQAEEEGYAKGLLDGRALADKEPSDAAR